MYSSFAVKSAPSSFARTLCESIGRSLLRILIDAVIPSGTGLNSRLAALAFSASKSCPAIFNSLLPASSDSHPSMTARPMLRSGVTRSNFSRLLLSCTTLNP